MDLPKRLGYADEALQAADAAAEAVTEQAERREVVLNTPII